MQEDTRKKSKGVFGLTTRLTAVAFAGLIGLSVIVSNTTAGLDAIAFNTTPQVINSGTVSINLANGIDTGGTLNKGFSQTFDKMLPGDTQTVFVRLTNGTTAVRNLELSLSDSSAPNTRLTNDATQGLKLSVTSCPTAWSSTGTCSTPTTRVSNIAFSSINTSITSTLFTSLAGITDIAANEVQYLKFDVVLPDINETTTNGATPANSIQGLAANVTWKFKVSQRAATSTLN